MQLSKKQTNKQKSTQEQARERGEIQFEDHEDYKPKHMIIHDRQLQSLKVKDCRTLFLN